MEMEEVEEIFKQIGWHGRFNYFFCCRVEKNQTVYIMKSIMSAKKRQKNISGYLLNQTEKGICLIPINAEFRKNTLDIENYIIINQKDIKEVKISNKEIIYIKIQIILKDGTKYIMTTNKKIRTMPKHGENVEKFIKIYKK